MNCSRMAQLPANMPASGGATKIAADICGEWTMAEIASEALRGLALLAVLAFGVVL